LLSRRVTGGLQAAMADFGVSYGEWGAMAVLARRRHAFHSELARVTGMSKGGVTKMMARLDQQGLVVREADVDVNWMADASRAPWELTPLGWATLEVLEAIADEGEDLGFGHMAPDARQALVRTLRGLARHHGWDLPEEPGHWRDIRAEAGEGWQVAAPSPARRRGPIRR
jgi:DNA-binding MarR family transcriptional regulator